MTSFRTEFKGDCGGELYLYGILFDGEIESVDVIEELEGFTPIGTKMMTINVRVPNSKITHFMEQLNKHRMVDRLEK